MRAKILISTIKNMMRAKKETFYQQKLIRIFRKLTESFSNNVTNHVYSWVINEVFLFSSETFKNLSTNLTNYYIVKYFLCKFKLVLS